MCLWLIEISTVAKNVGHVETICEEQVFQVCSKGQYLPTRLASRGFMSNISVPCIFPRISKRSRPVACSRSVGTVPGAAPGGRRSDSLWISVLDDSISEIPSRALYGRRRAWSEVDSGRRDDREIRTFECQEFAFRVTWLWVIFRGLGEFVLSACSMNLLLAWDCSLSARHGRGALGMTYVSQGKW
jgi:hypothetical protein